MFNFYHLDNETRKKMVEEINIAADSGNLYYSKRFTQKGNEIWRDLLLQAAENFNEHWLAYQLDSENVFKGIETARNPLGGYAVKHIPHNASETLADGQFNRFYILGLCPRAAEEGKDCVTVYRAKERQNHRAESDSRIGENIYIDELIPELRNVTTSLKSFLLKPNSGLSVRL